MDTREYEKLTEELVKSLDFSKEKTEIFKALARIESDFNLTDEEMIVLCGLYLSYTLVKHRLKKIEEIRKAMKEVLKPEVMRKALFAHNEVLNLNYYELMVQDRFDEVLNDIAALSECGHA